MQSLFTPSQPRMSEQQNLNPFSVDRMQVLRRLRPVRNAEKWERIKDDIYQVYMQDDSTLPETIRLIGQKHSFKASERTWKTKLKAWGFEKNVPAADLAIVLAKSDKRKREDGKETAIFYHGAEVTTEKVARFKRRELDVAAVASPSADTPYGVTYYTPGPESTELNPEPEPSSRVEDVTSECESTSLVFENFQTKGHVPSYLCISDWPSLLLHGSHILRMRGDSGEFLPYFIYAYDRMRYDENLPVGDIEELFARREGFLHIFREPYDHNEIETLLLRDMWNNLELEGSPPSNHP